MLRRLLAVASPCTLAVPHIRGCDRGSLQWNLGRGGTGLGYSDCRRQVVSSSEEGVDESVLGGGSFQDGDTSRTWMYEGNTPFILYLSPAYLSSWDCVAHACAMPAEADWSLVDQEKCPMLMWNRVTMASRRR